MDDKETLGQKQDRFSRLLPRLTDKAWELGDKYGFTVRPGDLFRDPRLHGVMGEKKGYGHANSCHKLKLAIDLNFIKGQRIISEFHDELHDWWDTQGGSKRIDDDLNHYSFEHDGHR